ncbi:hypothetical protein PBY51_000801 [Eleginops maclovinus]|uniref:Uncharacterized protein n=1 Tax=Eleginops maclovinus TaxID=56733 RepID=A0AAN8AIE1_ELEMC|nr:hypothetical protein PBY51_000801 [Eleginops maclovinus]
MANTLTYLGWGVPLWDILTVSSLIYTPLHMLTSSCLEQMQGGASSPTAALRVEAESGATELKEDITFVAARCGGSTV